MYKMPESLLADNPINRYLLNSTMMPQFKRDADGGLPRLGLARQRRPRRRAFRRPLRFRARQVELKCQASGSFANAASSSSQ